MSLIDIKISSIDDFLEKYQEIEANMPTMPMDRDVLLQ